MMLDIVFRGVTAPLRLNGAEAVLEVLPGVAVGWPYDCVKADPSVAPFFTISSEPGTALLRCDCHVEDRPSQRFDPVNAVCDAVSALALALPAEHPGLICLHAAGVALGGRLVIFPNVRRAGKSTLSAALARAGHPVFSDDVVPVFLSEGGHGYGLAMGLSPRLRLPLPEALGAGFADWVGSVSGPGNRQYRYLTPPDQPAHGAVLPIGAFVILDRRDTPGPASLQAVSPDVAMDVLLHQNFTRDRHSADILSAIAKVLAERPAFTLSYAGLDDAVACLEAAFADWPGSKPSADPGPARAFRQADFAARPAAKKATGGLLVQRAGCLSVPIGDRLYLADAEGRAIHRMDPLAAAIWSLVEEPIRTDAILEILTEAFPDVEPDRLAADLNALVRRLVGAGLVESRAVPGSATP
ncbi:MAG: PqqD family peptide modification chaperone [Tabrizicola sp.]|nr:PqqD family peptide modification chaperone [Tabrizicola sp.]